jgi:histidine triad (HIT) family protein
MASIFTKILRGELPCYKIFEDDLSFAFLALDQVNLGHTLVISKKEVDHWLNVPEDIYLRVQKNSQVIGRAIQKSTDCPRVGQMVAGFEVPHYHLHLIPAWSIPDLSFARAQKRSDQEMKEIQQKILSHL